MGGFVSFSCAEEAVGVLDLIIYYYIILNVPVEKFETRSLRVQPKFRTVLYGAAYSIP